MYIKDALQLCEELEDHIALVHTDKSRCLYQQMNSFPIQGKVPVRDTDDTATATTDESTGPSHTLTATAGKGSSR